MRGVGVERFYVEHAKCLADIVGSHCRSSGMARKLGGSLLFVITTMIPV